MKGVVHKTFFKSSIKKLLSYTSVVVVVFLLCLFLFFKFGFYHLDKFETADEHLWTTYDGYLLVGAPSLNVQEGRIQKYWDAVANKQWSLTRINDKPGVSLALISGMGYLFGPHVGDLVAAQGKFSLSYNVENIQRTLLNYRIPLVILTGLMSIFFFAYVWRLTGNKFIALVTSSLILLAPTLVGISQIVNPDALLWPFAFASLLAFFVFLKRGRFIDVFLTALFLGFALLSKYVALILIPFYLIAALAYLFFEYEDLKEKNVLLGSMRKIFVGYAFAVAGGIGVFALGMPALLIKKGLLYKLTIGFGSLGSKMLYVLYVEIFFLVDCLLLKGMITNWLLKKSQFLKHVLPRLLYAGLASMFVLIFINFAFGHNFLGSTDVDFAPQSNIQALFVNGVVPQVSPWVFSLTPVVSFLLIFLWAKLIFKRSAFEYIVFPSSLFIVIYYYAMYVQRVGLGVRYSVLLYPIAILLAGIGFYEFNETVKIKNKTWIVALLAIGVIAANGVSTWKSMPFYFNYSTDLLPKKYSITKGWGYGEYEAAQYINTQAKGRDNLMAWGDYDGFCPFLKGECLFPNTPKIATNGRLDKTEYFVTTAQGQEKNSPSTDAILRYNPDVQLVWELDIDGRGDNFVRVYKNTTWNSNQTDN